MSACKSIMFTIGLGLMLVACAGARSTSLGPRHGKLMPCPGSPNCVSSQATDAAHTVEPIVYKGAAKDAMEQVAHILKELPRVRIATQTGEYLHAEFTSAIMRFVDDVEFLVDDNAELIHVRSASRVGYSDFGVNRKRVEMLRERYRQNMEGPGKNNNNN